MKIIILGTSSITAEIHIQLYIDVKDNLLYIKTRKKNGVGDVPKNCIQRKS